MSRAKGPVVKGGSREARCLAAAILEVLAGGLSPSEAAGALGVSAQRYYVLEKRALEGLIAGCEPRSKGRTRGPEAELVELRAEHDRTRRDLARSQSLVRLAQRAAGYSAPKPRKDNKDKRGRKRRKPAVRAMVASKLLQSVEPEKPETVSAGD